MLGHTYMQHRNRRMISVMWSGVVEFSWKNLRDTGVDTPLQWILVDDANTKPIPKLR